MTFTPTIYKLQSIKPNDSIYKDTNVSLATFINQPLFSLGYHSFINRTKSSMDITKKLETKNEFYYIVNPFEPTINDYKDSISDIASTYLSLKQPIKFRSFYKMWEILTMFDIANKPKMIITGLEIDEGFIQAYIHYREKFYSIENDKINTVQFESKDFI